MDDISTKIRSYHNDNIKSNEPCFIGTNEQNLSVIEKILIQPIKIEHGIQCHIGFSGWYNFDIAYWRKSDRIILCDINCTQIEFLKQTLYIIRQNRIRQAFLAHMILYLDERMMTFSLNVNEDKAYESFRSYGTSRDEINQVSYEFERLGSWLNNDKSYTYIRKLRFIYLIFTIG